jgi:cytochrome b involved in lipid metabolism
MKKSVDPTSVPLKMNIITRSELACHNNPSSAWCAIHSSRGMGEKKETKYGTEDGKEEDGSVGGRYIVLDVTNFASVHPGGDLILLAAGKDASVLFETYHPRGIPRSLVEKLRIGTMEDGSFGGGSGSFYSWDSDFYATLKSRVVKRLEERGLSRRGSYEIQIKALLLLVGFWYSLSNMACSAHRPYLVSAMWSMVMGIFAALIGTNIQHDGNHGAFAKSKFMNKIAGWTMDMIGASAFTWEIQHMLGHHPYTNVLDMVEEEKKGMGVDCKLEEKDQVRIILWRCDWARLALAFLGVALRMTG